MNSREEKIITYNKKIDIDLNENSDNNKIENNSKKIFMKNELYSFNNKNNNLNYYDQNNSEEMNDLLKLDKEFEERTDYPKNYGNMWTNNERNIIIKSLKKQINKTDNIFNDKIIEKISKKLGRSEGGIKSEIKKIIFNKYIDDCLKIDEISDELNISESNIKLIISIYMEKNINKTIEFLDKENKVLKLKIENLKLKKELKELKELKN